MTRARTQKWKKGHKVIDALDYYSLLKRKLIGNSIKGDTLHTLQFRTGILNYCVI